MRSLGRANLSLFEAIIIFNLVVLLYLVYQVSKLKTELETVYQGLAVAMTEQERLMQKIDP